MISVKFASYFAFIDLCMSNKPSSLGRNQLGHGILSYCVLEFNSHVFISENFCFILFCFCMCVFIQLGVRVSMQNESGNNLYISWNKLRNVDISSSLKACYILTDSGPGFLC